MALYSAEGHPDKLLPNIRKNGTDDLYNVLWLFGSWSTNVSGMWNEFV